MPIGSGVIGSIGATGGTGTFVPVAPPTGVAATDGANIAAAIAALPTTGGTVQLQAGTYAVSSAARTDTGVTYAAGTWTDAAITAGDVGKYVLGAGIQGRAPLIQTVNAGVSFTTDIAPAGTVSAATVWIVAPGIVQPENVKIRGAGGIGGGSTTLNSFSTGSAITPTRIADAGTGVTVLVRGAPGPTGYFNARYGLYDLSLWGTGTAVPTVAGSALIGLFIGNNAWFYEADNVDFSWYATCGAANDYNGNASDFRNCSFQNNGAVAATTATGGFLAQFFSGTASAGINFYNCFFFQNFGCGVGPGRAGVFGAYGVNIYACQFASTFSTSWPTYSGISMLLIGGNAELSRVDGTWSETAGNQDFWVNSGGVTFTSCEMYTSAHTHNGTVYGHANFIGCFFNQPSGTCVDNHGTISWVDCDGTGTNFWTGCQTLAAAQGAGSTNVTTHIGGTSTAGTATVTSPTVTSGAAFTPNATQDSMVYIQINAGGGAGSYTVTMGPSTGAENTIASSVALLNASDESVTLRAPAGWKVIVTVVTVTIGQTRVVTC